MIDLKKKCKLYGDLVDGRLELRNIIHVALGERVVFPLFCSLYVALSSLFAFTDQNNNNNLYS